MINRYDSTGVKPWMSVDAERQCIIIRFDGSGSVDIEATVSDLNSNDEAVPFPIPALQSITANTAQKIEFAPITAFRVNVASITGNVTVQVKGF